MVFCANFVFLHNLKVKCYLNAWQNIIHFFFHFAPKGLIPHNRTHISM